MNWFFFSLSATNKLRNVFRAKNFHLNNFTSTDHSQQCRFMISLSRKTSAVMQTCVVQCFLRVWLIIHKDNQLFSKLRTNLIFCRPAKLKYLNFWRCLNFHFYLTFLKNISSGTLSWARTPLDFSSRFLESIDRFILHSYTKYVYRYSRVL